MKILSFMALISILAGCASAPATVEKPPQTTERSDRAHQELDKEMGN